MGRFINRKLVLQILVLGMEKKGFRFLPKPVKVGEEYDVKIEDTSRRGDGVARIKGLVVFIPGGKKGEEAHIRITQVGRKFAIGEIV